MQYMKSTSGGVNRFYLDAGIQFWLEKKSKWPRDFHNGFYRQLAQLRTKGLTADWWETIVDFLAQWVAIRPRTKHFIREHGQASLVDLNSRYSIICSKCEGNIPSNMLVEWKDVEPLFTAARAIKDVSSPVFASKLCHFIVPGVFPVVDQAVLGGSESYKDYWCFYQDIWRATSNTESLVKELADKIGTDIVVPDYPWTTKIVELSLIGQRANSGQI